MACFVRFLRDLFDQGQVGLPLIDQTEPPDFASLAAREVLWDRDQMLRLSLAGTAPDLEMEAALDGAAWLYQGCQLFIERSRSAEDYAAEVAAGLERWEPSSAAVYAVDLTLSFLPDLHRHARQHAEADPLMEVLGQLAGAWPLSSVGVPGTEPSWDRIAPWWGERSLRQLYIDRILARDDGDRLCHAQVRDQVRSALGAHAEALAGEAVWEVLCR